MDAKVARDLVVSDDILEPLAVDAGGQDLERVHAHGRAGERAIDFVTRREQASAVRTRQDLTDNWNGRCDFADKIEGCDVTLQREALSFKVDGALSGQADRWSCHAQVIEVQRTVAVGEVAGEVGELQSATGSQFQNTGQGGQR